MSEQFFKQPSVMTAQQHFSQLPAAEIQRSTFNRSHSVKTTFDAGKLIPFYLDEVLPGDTFRMNSTNFTRLATPLKPLMDNIFLDTHFFFVPTRLLWDDWQKFMGERPDPDFDPNTVVLPKMPWIPPLAPTDTQTVMRYMGLPRLANDLDGTTVSCLPIRAYRLIWNEWYRDQNLQDRIPFTTGAYSAGSDADLLPLPRGKRHDYFTSCLPWPQKGDPVLISLTGDAPVFGIDTGANSTDSIIKNRQGGTGVGNPITGAGTNSGNVQYLNNGSPWPQNVAYQGILRPDLQVAYADLSGLTAVSINELRTAFQIQRLLERDARGGTRYIELILSHFGVHSDDARLQRPEYLGGGSSRININPLASTAATAGAPQANLAGVGTSINNAHFAKSFTEHGYVIGLVSARADLSYQNTVDRLWSRTTRYDFYWPTLAHLGEQAVLNKELNFTGLPEDDDDVFGYQERYAEYRYKPSLITGLFNSNCATPIDQWHLAQEFSVTAGPIELNEAFIVENPPIDRVIAVPAEPHFMCDIWNDLNCDRPMPVYSVPGLIDHF